MRPNPLPVPDLCIARLGCMKIILYFLLQLLNYGPWWILFVALVFCAARYPPSFCLPLPFLVAAVVIYCIDFNWVQSEMRKPDWDGTPDLDIVFMFGVLFRVVLAGILLTPVAIAGVILRRRCRKKRFAQPVA